MELGGFGELGGWGVSVWGVQMNGFVSVQSFLQPGEVSGGGSDPAPAALCRGRASSVLPQPSSTHTG